MTILDKFKLSGKTAARAPAPVACIGKAMAIALAEAGADIVATSAGMETDRLPSVAKEIEALGRKCWTFACDLADRPSVYAFIEQVKRDCPPDRHPRQQRRHHSP